MVTKPYWRFHRPMPSDDLPESEDINYLSGAGKGVTLIELAKSDEVCSVSKRPKGIAICFTVETNRGAKKTVSTAKYRVTSRGGKGNEIQKNGKIAKDRSAARRSSRAI